MTSELRRQQARLAVHESWARTADRAARTAPARAARQAKYVERARELHSDGAPKLIAQVAESLRRADMARMSFLAAKARRERAEAA